MEAVFSVTLWTWAVLVAIVLLLAACRLLIVVRNHMLVPHHVSAIHHLLQQVDRWGETLTTLALVLAIVLAALYVLLTFGEVPGFVPDVVTAADLGCACK